MGAGGPRCPDPAIHRDPVRFTGIRSLGQVVTATNSTSNSSSMGSKALPSRQLKDREGRLVRLNLKMPGSGLGCRS